MRCPETAGIKLFPVPACDGKIQVKDLEKFKFVENDQHWVQPKLVSITQSTECGTLYSREEVLAISAFCKSMGWYLHMDGARISNAAVSLGCNLREVSKDLGVDVLSLGGTKNGLMAAEAVLFFNDKLIEGFKFFRKQRLQLSSKMRYLVAQFDAFFDEDLWKECALNANEQAKYLADSCVATLGSSCLAGHVEANEVFIHLPDMEFIQKLMQKWDFHIWDAQSCLVRFVCSFDTLRKDVDALIDDI